MKAFLVFPVIDDDIEAAGHGNEKLMTLLQSVTGAIRPARNVVEVKDTFDVEGDVPASLEESEIPPGIIDLRKFNDAAFGKFHCKHI